MQKIDSQQRIVIVVGASGLIGQKIVPVFQNTGCTVVRVSSRPQEFCFASLDAALRSVRDVHSEKNVVYLNYVQNPLANLFKIFEACRSAREQHASSFFYFSTFAHNPSFCGIKKASAWPRFRSIVTFYNVNKFLAEFAFIFLAKFLLPRALRAFVVCPGFVIGKDMIWPKMIRDLMKSKEIVCPPLQRRLPVIDAEELGQHILECLKLTAVASATVAVKFERVMSIRELIKHSVAGIELPWPKIIEQDEPASSQDGVKCFPREIFYFSKRLFSKNGH